MMVHNGQIMVPSSITMHNDLIMVHNSSIMVHILKYLNNSAYLNNGSFTNLPFSN